MTIYRIYNNFEAYYSFMIRNVELGSKMPNYSPKFRAKTRLNDWVKPDATFYASDNYASEAIRIPDITTWLTGNLVLNQKAYTVLSDKLANCGEFLPVSVEGIDYYIFNTLQVLDDETVGETRLGDCMVFKTSTDKLLASYCTDEFKQLIEEAGLQGLVFNPDLAGVF